MRGLRAAKIRASSFLYTFPGKYALPWAGGWDGRGSFSEVNLENSSYSSIYFLFSKVACMERREGGRGER